MKKNSALRTTSHPLPDIDRGWAWVVLVTAYVGMFIYCNAMYMGGIVFRELLRAYDEGETKTSLVGALNTGFLCFGAPFAGIIINKYSCRVAIVFGSLISTIGLASCAFVNSLDAIIVMGGLLVGLGYASLSAGIICVIGFYFQKYRDTVISFAFCIVGFAMFLSAPFALYLLDTYGLSGLFLILAGINAQICVIGVIGRPSVLELGVQIDKKTIRRNSIRTLQRRDSVRERSKTYLDLSLLKNVSFVCFLISTSSWNFGLNVGIMHLPNFVFTSGGTNSDISIIMILFSVGNIIGRLLGSLTVSKLDAKSIRVHITVLMITGILTSAFPLYSKFNFGAYIFSVQLGIFCGLPNAMMTPLSLSFVGLSKLSEAYGLAYLFCGFGVTSGPILVGYLYSSTGSYVYSFVLAGVVLIIGSCSALLGQCLKANQPKDEPRELVIDNIKSQEPCPEEKILIETEQ